jgi:hypothetical protein
MKKYLTVPETAAETGKTERAVWHDIYRGKVPYRRWGRKILVPRAELEEFLNNLPGVSAEEAVTRAEEISNG